MSLRGGPRDGGRTRPATASADGGAPPRALRQLLAELGAAKRRLFDETEVLRDIEARVRGWDMSESFQARRGQALRIAAAMRFGRALDDLHGLLVRMADARMGPAFTARPTSSSRRRLVAEIRNELRYLQRAFDGGNLLLATALESFSAP